MRKENRDPGQKSWSDNYLGGLIDEVKIYTRALTAAEVKRLHDETLRKSR